MKDDDILRLSDAFEPGEEGAGADIEVRVRMININYGQNREILKACRPLMEYAWLVEQIRENRGAEMDIEKAVDKAIDDIPEEYEIRMFLIGHRAEVRDMCITEYNEAETMRMIREESREEGREEGQMELLAKMVKSGDMSLKKAAEYAKMTVEQFSVYGKQVL